MADRMERRPYLVRITLLQLAIAAVLALLAFANLLTLPAVMVLSVLMGCANALLSPAYNALLAELVPPADLLSALSLSSAQWNLARILGPALAAGLVAWGGVRWAFLANAGSFVFVLASFLAVREARHRPARATTPLIQGLREGWAASRRDPGLSAPLLMVLGATALISPFIGLLPAFSLKVLGATAAQTSLLVSIQGLGAVSAALVAGSLAERVGQVRTVNVAMLGIGPVAALFWLSPGLGLAEFSLFFLGALYMLLMSGLFALFQQRAPQALQARTASVWGAAIGGGYAAGLVLIGTVGDSVGLRLAGTCAALAFLALAMTLGRVVRRALDSPLSEPAPEVPPPVRA